MAPWFGLLAANLHLFNRQMSMLPTFVKPTIKPVLGLIKAEVGLAGMVVVLILAAFSASKVCHSY